MPNHPARAVRCPCLHQLPFMAVSATCTMPVLYVKCTVPVPKHRALRLVSMPTMPMHGKRRNTSAPHHAWHSAHADVCDTTHARVLHRVPVLHHAAQCPLQAWQNTKHNTRVRLIIPHHILCLLIQHTSLQNHRAECPCNAHHKRMQQKTRRCQCATPCMAGSSVRRKAWQITSHSARRNITTSHHHTPHNITK